MEGEVKRTVQRTERGWPGHYCECHRCLFRRNTLLELGDLRIVVSTVGAKRVHPSTIVEKISLDHYYETEAFHAEHDDGYWDADIHRSIQVKSMRAILHTEHHADREANDMHEAVVAEISERMISGRIES